MSDIAYLFPDGEFHNDYLSSQGKSLSACVKGTIMFSNGILEVAIQDCDQNSYMTGWRLATEEEQKIFKTVKLLKGF